MRVVLLDFDGTVTEHDSTRVLIFALLLRRPWRLMWVGGDLLRLALGGSAEVLQAAKDRCVGTLIRGLSEAQLRQCLSRYKEEVGLLIRPRMAALIRDQAEEGQHVLVVTASADFAVTRALEDFPVTVIGTRFAKMSKAFTGKVDGIPCYGPGKVQHIRDWAERQTEAPRFLEGWSDSLADLPMLELAERRVWICRKERAQPFRERDPKGEVVLVD